VASKAKKTTKTAPKSKQAASRRSAPGRVKSQSPGDYAREALTEWRKAARFGASALLVSGAGTDKNAKSKEDKPPLKERLNPTTTEKGGRVGDAADNVLSKFGFLGKAASKLSLGSRAVDKVVPDAVTKLQPSSGGGGASGNGSHGHPAVPIQESINVAVPIHAAWALAMRFEDYPQWSDRIESAEQTDKGVAAEVKVLGVPRSLEVRITEEHPEWRLEWEATKGVEHGGMLTFHELAPSLTHVELSIDIEPESLVQRLGRTIHLPERAIRAEMHLFKAWAELWQEVEDIEPPEEPEDEADLEEEPVEEAPVDEEEPEDEADLEEEPEDEEELEGEEDDALEDEYDEPEDEYEEPEDEYDDEDEDEEEPEDEFVDEGDEDFDEEGLDEEGEPAGTR
jgi:uncharacterized membrane protein